MIYFRMTYHNLLSDKWHICIKQMTKRTSSFRFMTTCTSTFRLITYCTSTFRLMTYRTSLTSVSRALSRHLYRTDISTAFQSTTTTAPSCCRSSTKHSSLSVSYPKCLNERLGGHRSSKEQIEVFTRQRS